MFKKFSIAILILSLSAPLLAQTRTQPVLTTQESTGATGDARQFFGDSPDNPGPIATDLDASLSAPAVNKIITRVADWQLTRAEPHFNQQWTFGALYCGFMAATQTTGDLKYHDAMTALGDKFKWDVQRPGVGGRGRGAPRGGAAGGTAAATPPPTTNPAGAARTQFPINANSLCLSQTYLELYQQYKADWMLTPSRQVMDDNLTIEFYPTRFPGRGLPGAGGAGAPGGNDATPAPDAGGAPPDAGGAPATAPARGRGRGNRGGGGDQGMAADTNPHHLIWWWCDALYMAPAAWTHMYKITGDKKYLDYVDHQWWLTSQYLYDNTDHLYYRDASFIAKKEHNGKKVYWSRGEGWVIGGLVRVLEDMPKDYPSRPKFEQQFKEMCAAIADNQNPDGLWRAGMFDPDYYVEPENSGGSFFVYGMAYGVNSGLLDRAKFEPVIAKGWAGLVSHIHADGRLDCIQQTGSGPAHFKTSSSYVYGVGAFLLAGQEVSKLSLAATKPSR